MKVVQTYSSQDCNEFDVIVNDCRIAYYIEHFKHPCTTEVLQKPIYEIYYDYNEDDEDFLSSVITDNYNELQDIIESVYDSL
jgi:hypothetical protein